MERPLILAVGLMMVMVRSGEAQEPVDIKTLVRQAEVFMTADGEPYSGPAFSVFATDPTKIREKGTLKNGEWEGLYEAFYFDGSIESRINYKDTQYHGLFERFYGNGAPIAKGMYEMGARCGDWLDVGGNGEVYPPCPGS